MQLTILYECDSFVAVNKPCGMLVHRTKLAGEATEFVLQVLKDQVGKHLYPVHRLDRPTSGVLLFAYNSHTARQLNDMLVGHEVQKEYHALVRGWFPDEISLDYPVKNDRGNEQEACTDFKLLKRYILDYPIGNYPSARYSLVACFPRSGRWHQIRQHLAHLRHYIINDRVHGDGKHNHIFKYILNIEPMFLHAASLTMRHPITREILRIEAPYPPHWEEYAQIDILSETNLY